DGYGDRPHRLWRRGARVRPRSAAPAQGDGGTPRAGLGVRGEHGRAPRHGVPDLPAVRRLRPVPLGRRGRRGHARRRARRRAPAAAAEGVARAARLPHELLVPRPARRDGRRDRDPGSGGGVRGGRGRGVGRGPGRRGRGHPPGRARHAATAGAWPLGWRV
ncbi:MAG: hypothetical protein AVDCRST_MAG11-2067, partial [uncultured Gemmatimonadaceae bacterium]